jgi:pirin-like protein
MNTIVETKERVAVLVEDAAKIRMMGMPILEALPSRSTPYEEVDPFILLHEARLRLSDLANVDTRHPHRGFDNLWYLLEGSVSTGHSTGPGGAMERARLNKGALLALRTGRGAWHAEAMGADEPGLEGEAAFGPTGCERSRPSLYFWARARRSPSRMRPSAHGSCSWLASGMVRLRDSTGHTSIRVIASLPRDGIYGRESWAPNSSARWENSIKRIEWSRG